MKKDQKTTAENPSAQDVAKNPPSSSSAEDATAKIAELTDDLKRTRADFENYRKQIDVQKATAINLAKLETVKGLLPLLDDIDRAIASTPELQPLGKSLEKTIKDLGLAKIDAAPGTDFNPDFHDAISMEDSGGEKELVAEVLRPGYLYGGTVLRPALVKVKTA